MRAQAAARASSSADADTPDSRPIIDPDTVTIVRPLTPPPTSDPPADSSIGSPLLQIHTSCRTQTNPHVPASENRASPLPPIRMNPTPEAHVSKAVPSYPPIQTSVSPELCAPGPSVRVGPTPQTRDYSTVSELSDLEKSAEKAPEKKKKAATKKGKKKAAILSSDEEQGAESSVRPRHKVSKRGKK